MTIYLYHLQFLLDKAVGSCNGLWLLVFKTRQGEGHFCGNIAVNRLILYDKKTKQRSVQ